MLTIRPATDADHDAIWEIFREVIAVGETYPIDPNIPREQALAYWFNTTRTFMLPKAKTESSAVTHYIKIKPPAAHTWRTRRSLFQKTRAGGGSVARWASIV